MLHLNTLGRIIAVSVALNVGMLVLWLIVGLVAGFLYGNRGKNFSYKIFSPLFRAEGAAIKTVGGFISWPIRRHYQTLLEESLGVRFGRDRQLDFERSFYGQIHTVTCLFGTQEDLRSELSKLSPLQEGYDRRHCELGESLRLVDVEIARRKGVTCKIQELAKKAGLRVPDRIDWSKKY